VPLSEATVRRHTEAAGAAYAAVQAAEAERLERTAPAPPAGPAVQQVSADGAMVPLLGGEWAEAKTLVIGVVAADDAAGEPRARELSYFARLADHQAFRRGALVEAHRRGTETAGTVVGVMDGAEWLQGFLDFHRPDAVRVLDFPHALQHLAGAARACFGAEAPEVAGWLAEQAHELKHGDPARVLAAVRGLPAERATDPGAAAAAVTATLGYLEKRREQLRYAEFRARGYPIASGSAEGGNKTVVQARLKGCGMRWARLHVDPMLALRTVTCSGRWAEAWPQICGHLRAARPGRRAARRPPPPPRPLRASSPPGPPEAVAPRPARSPRIVGGRPTADHPWRHPFLPGGRRHAAAGPRS
jgi:hypothetical protein